MLKNKNKKVELLSPAGNIESFKAAISCGADAVYMGVDKFNARVMAQNFTVDSYIECIKFAHLRKKQVYLTLNTLMTTSEVKEALELVIELYSRGLDAAILQDIGLASLIHKIIPDLPMHASTQMSVYSLEQVKYLESIGFSRVVLARELTIDEIEYICNNTDIEIEVFVHGALCVSMSGQCLLSSTIGDRSANKGACAQPCRMKYSLYDEQNKKICSDKYLLSKKDIYGLEHIQKLIDIGVTSLKIEGRNKTPEYVAGVTGIYRKYVDSKEQVKISDKITLMQLFNRNGLSAGYLDGVKLNESITDISPKNTGLLLGKVLEVYNHFVKVKLEYDTDLHDGIEIYSKDQTVSTIVTCIKNDNGVIVNSKMTKGNFVWLGDVTKKVNVGDNIYKTSSNKLNQELKSFYLNNDCKSKYDVEVYIKTDKKVTAVVKDLCIEVSIDYIPQIAEKKSISKEDIINCFSKTNDTSIIFEEFNVDVDPNLFVPVSKLNLLRRELTQKIENSFDIIIDKEQYLKNMNEVLEEGIVTTEIKKESSNSLYVYDYNNTTDYINEYMKKHGYAPDRIYFDIMCFKPFAKDIISKYKGKTKIYISISNYVGSNVRKYIDEELENLVSNAVDGILCGSYICMDKLKELKQKYNIKLIADYSLNISNFYSAKFLYEQGFDIISLSHEMSSKDVINISKYYSVEVLSNMITVMTSRYCMLGSFVNKDEKDTRCSAPCALKKYYIKDSYGKRYHIVSDRVDCIMRIVKDIKFNLTKEAVNENAVSKRYCML